MLPLLKLDSPAGPVWFRGLRAKLFDHTLHNIHDISGDCPSTHDTHVRTHTHSTVGTQHTPPLHWTTTHTYTHAWHACAHSQHSGCPWFRCTAQGLRERRSAVQIARRRRWGHPAGSGGAHGQAASQRTPLPACLPAPICDRAPARPLASPRARVVRLVPARRSFRKLAERRGHVRRGRLPLLLRRRLLLLHGRSVHRRRRDLCEGRGGGRSGAGSAAESCRGLRAAPEGKALQHNTYLYPF